MEQRNIGCAPLETRRAKSGHTIGNESVEEVAVLSISGARNSIIPLRRIRGRSEAAASQRRRIQGTGIGVEEGGLDGASPITREFHFHISFRLAFYLPPL